MTFRLRLALRLPAVSFFLMTSCFGLLSYVPFAYLQFLRHQLFDWLQFFVVFHHFLYWAALLLGLLSISDDLTARRPLPWLITSMFSAFGVWLIFHPLLPMLISNRRSFIVALLSLAFPVALAMVDHMSGRGKSDAGARTADQTQNEAWERFALAGLYVWATFTAVAMVRLVRTDGGRLDVVDWAFGSGWALALHIAVATLLVGVTAAIQRVRSRHARHVLTGACMAVVVWSVLIRIIFPSIAFRGLDAIAFATIVACSAALVWSGLVVRAHATGARPVQHTDEWSRAIILIVMPVAAFAAVESIAKFDWYFLLQRLVAIGVWIGALMCLPRKRIPDPFRRAVVTAMAISVVVVAGRVAAIDAASSRWALAVDRYASYDPAMMLLDSALSPPSSDLADLTRFLVINSNVEHAVSTPIDFVASWDVPRAKRPHIFVFVIDSLRRDYLSPYNAAVQFTPAIDAFARESATFTRAYTRYGGTGLSEPAIWAGAMLPHLQYPTPFAPMNALEKLLIAEKYHRLVSVDSILHQLLTPSPDMHELDAGIQNRRYELCRTLNEVRSALPAITRDGRPAFVFTQSQDVHLANVAVDREGASGDPYPGFYAPYAARLARLDACLGAFVAYLKDIGIYDNSIVVLTSDHGDSLGDAGRWGHAYTVFPEVIRVPLIMHVPPQFGHAADVDTLAFTTDITPTLYNILGHEPSRRDGIFGIPLIGAHASTVEHRRTDPYVVASSYGPVYGVLTNNGDDLYIIDGVNTAEHRYDLRRGLNGDAIVMTRGERSAAATALRHQVGELARFYRIR